MEGDFLFSGRQILKNTLLLTAAALLLRLVSMLLQAYLSARIGADGLGLVQLVLSVCAFSMTLGLAGARVAATCLCAQAHGRRSRAEVQSAVYQCLGYVLVTSCTVSAILFFAAPWLSGKLLQEPAAEAGLRLLAGMLPSACVNLVLGGYFTATGQVLRLTAVDMGERVLCLGLTFLFLQVSGSDAAGACLALLSGDLLSGCAATALLYCLFRRNERGVFSENQDDMGRRVRHLAVPLALSDYLRAALRTLEQFLIPWGLVRYGAARQDAMGVYGTVTGMVFPVLMLPAALLYALIDLLIPELAACRAQGRKERLASITGQCLRAGLLFSSFIAGLLFVLAEPAAQLLYGSAQAGRLLRFFAPLALMLYMDALTDGMLKGLSEQVATVRYNTITSVLDVLLLFFLLPRWGTAGYLFTFVAAHVLNFALSLRRLVLASGCRPGVRAALQTGLCAAAACAGALLLPQTGGWWGLCLLRAAVFTAVYLAFACLSGTAELCLPQSLRPVGSPPVNARTDG